MSIIKLLLLITIILTTQTNKISKDKVVVAINCGGDQYTNKDGIEYIEDNYFDKGMQSEHGLNYDIQGTNEEVIYQTERWSSETLTYSIPLNEPGKYVFILKFSEVYFSAKNEKVFDIALGSKTIIKNLDIYSKVGRETAYDEYIEFELKNNKIYYKNKIISDAYDEDENKVLLKFLKGYADNPKINGIVLIKGTLKDTDYYEKIKINEEAIKKKRQMIKDEVKLALRHDPEIEYDENTIDNSDISDILDKKNENLLSLFSTVPGFSIIISVVTFFVLYYLFSI